MAGSSEIVLRVLGKWWGFMSCAIWTLFGLCVLIFNPASHTEVKIYFLLAAVSLLLALCQTIYGQHKELARLKSLPPEISLSIQDVVLHRTGDEEWRWKNGEFLVQASTTLLKTASTKVTYSAQLVFRGEVVDLIPFHDLSEWEIIERRYYKHLGEGIRARFATNPRELTGDLELQQKNEGWLHFRIEGMVESEIAKRTLRLYAVAKNGMVFCDEDLAMHHTVRSDLVAMRKYLPKQQ